MYSNESKKGFSVLDLIVKIIFAALFIFILIWLFNKKMPNMKPVYSGIFRENIKYMQDAGEAYFTDDKMPNVPGESVKLTLAEMENLNLVIPFTDKDGNACDKNSSYVSVTKLEEDDGYELKTNLVCGSESNYVVKKLGCHNYCPNALVGGTCPECNCEKENDKCEVTKVTEYQFRKLVSGSHTKYSCPSGYTLKGTNCVKSVIKDSKSAISTKTDTKTYVKPATLNKGDSTLKQLTTIVDTTVKTTDATNVPKTTTIDATANTSTSTIDATANTSTSTIDATAKTTTDTKDATAKTTTDTKDATAKTTTSTKSATQQSYSCTKYKTETQCTTKYRQESYSCNCKTTIVHGVSTTTCDTCYKSVPYQSCKDVQVAYTGTCYKYVCPSGYTLSGTTCTKKTTTYTCPSGYTLSGTKCTKKTTTYSCPSGYTLSGTKCNKKTTTYSCPSGYTLSGTKCSKTTYSYTCPAGYTLSGTKCNKKVTTYSCPSGTDVKEGTGASLRCYQVVSGSTWYTCDSGWKLNGSTCVKTENVTVKVKSCPKGYKMVGDRCNLYSTSTVKATATRSTSSYYKYIWSKNTSVAGYEPTGKTRTVNGEEICK